MITHLVSSNLYTYETIVSEYKLICTKLQNSQKCEAYRSFPAFFVEYK
jgi:hypothetical protein